MLEDLNERLARLACEGLVEISEDFADEIGRAPTVSELCELLTYGIQSSREELLADVAPRDVHALEPRLRNGSGADEASNTDDLNDNIFSLANVLWTDLAHAYRGEVGTRPTLDALTRAIVEGLHVCGREVLSDVELDQVVAIEPKTAAAGKPSRAPRLGDVLAIPAGAGKFYIAVVVAQNDFGTALGVFKGTGPAEPPSSSSPQPPLKYPVYSDDEFIRKGTWRIVGHDEGLLKLFPREPAVFHEEQLVPEYQPEMGPHGAAELPSGEWRDLTAEQAEEIGIRDGSYSQFVLPEELAEYLAQQMSRF